METAEGNSIAENLNESPYEKVGKCRAAVRFTYSLSLPQ
mgnify:CR=1 FL=1